MADDKNPQRNPIATEFQGAEVSPISEAKEAIIKGRLVRKDTNGGIEGATVQFTVKTTPATTISFTTDATGAFNGTFDASKLPDGNVDHELKYEGNQKSNLASAASCEGSWNICACPSPIVDKTLTVIGIAAESKVYDETASVCLKKVDVTLAGPDNQYFCLDDSNATGNFVNSDAGKDKLVQISGVTICRKPGSEDWFEKHKCEHYVLEQPTTTASIWRRRLKVTGTIADRIYDGTVATPIVWQELKLQDVKTGDIPSDRVTLDFSGAIANFRDPNAGQNKPVVVTGLKLAGQAACNYELDDPNLTATVTQVPLTVTGITVEDKAFDGTKTATLDFSCPALIGVLPEDIGNVGLDTSLATGNFTDPNPGTAKNVTVKKLSLSGTAAGNYYVPLDKLTLTADITAAPPGNNLMKAVGRILGDPAANAGVSQLVRNASTLFGGKPAGDSSASVQGALDSIANALAGTDAVEAVAEPFGGQLRLEIYLNDAVSGKKELIKPEFLRNVDIQLIDANWNLATSTRADDKDGILFSQVDPGDVFVALPSGIAEGVVSDQYDVMDGGSCEFVHKTRDTAHSTATAKPLSAAVLAKPAVPAPAQTGGFRAAIADGKQSKVRLYVNPALAQVRCFSCLAGETSCCDPGKQFISNVSIEVLQGDNIRLSGSTGSSGCKTFSLPPGWYSFSARDEVTIDSCNYTLASSSPIFAFVGAGQGCSDIFFTYKKKGNEIEVISEIVFPEAGDPFEEAKDNFPGMQYLLLSESDPTFAQQQTTADGSAIYFRNLAVGTYWLFCQAPATYGTQPVQPVYPLGGRLSLRVFGGQIARVPIRVKFQTSTTAPAVLDGIVRDDTGSAIAGQLVTVVNNAGTVVAAGLSDATGRYSIQIYSADNVTIVAGSQQTSVSKAQIQADMLTVGKPTLPSPRAALNTAVQLAELPGFGD